MKRGRNDHLDAKELTDLRHDIRAAYSVKYMAKKYNLSERVVYTRMAEILGGVKKTRTSPSREIVRRIENKPRVFRPPNVMPSCAAKGLSGEGLEFGSQQFGVDLSYCDADLGLSLDDFSARFIVPMMDMLAASIPSGARISSAVLEIPAGATAACERLSGIALRCILDGNLTGKGEDERKSGRFDITVEPRA